MDTKDVTAVLLKIVGLVIVAYAAFTLPYYFSPEALSSSQFSLTDTLMSALFYLALPVVFGLFLWFLPATIINRIVSGEKLASARFGVVEFERVALTVLGVWLVVYGIGDLVATLVWIYRSSAEYAIVPARVFAGVVASVVKILLGFALAVGARSVSRVLQRFRGRDDG